MHPAMLAAKYLRSPPPSWKLAAERVRSSIYALIHTCTLFLSSIHVCTLSLSFIHTRVHSLSHRLTEHTRKTLCTCILKCMHTFTGSFTGTCSHLYTCSNNSHTQHLPTCANVHKHTKQYSTCKMTVPSVFIVITQHVFLFSLRFCSQNKYIHNASK